MFIGYALVAVIGYFIGVLIERYKWVGSSKTGKFIEVDGILYRTTKAKFTNRGEI